MKPSPHRSPTSWQLITFLVLILLPLVLFGGVGAWALWTQGHLFWLSWSLPVCWTFAWFVLQRMKRISIPLPEIGSRDHWTPHDHAARAIIEVEESRLEGVTPKDLTDIQFFRDRTLDLANKLARHYYPNAKDPLDKLSVVEILTVAQLVAEDLEQWFQLYVPGSHLITVQQWRLLAQAPGWWKMATNVGWAASLLTNPLAATAGRYAMSKAIVDPVSKQIQAGLLGTFFTLYMRQVGFYLLELNSGRLRGGAREYRRMMRQLEEGGKSQPGSPTDVADAPPVTVTIAVIGQVKAGKSSLVNCLLGSRQAAVDVLPQTRAVDRYELHLEESSDKLVLLDTPGYSDAGATAEQVKETREAVRQADLILLVMAATSPAKQSDARMLEELTTFFRDQHRLKPPPMIGVISKIDGLRPVMEWSPPYDWEQPSRLKEESIREAMDYARKATGDILQAAVPVCTDKDRGHVFGIEEWLLPMIITQLDEARAVSLVRSLHRDYDQHKLQKVLGQFAAIGKRLVSAITNPQ